MDQPSSAIIVGEYARFPAGRFEMEHTATTRPQVVGPITTLAVALLGALLVGCAGIPKGVEPVTDFDLERYLGTWYEIARLDHRFERGLTDISATYRLRDDGGIDVVNRGYSVQSAEWKEATGKAYFVGDPHIGRLKVSFFGPFYGGYNIVALDHDNYEYAMIAGPNRSYLWILARKPHLPSKTIDRLTAKAEQLGFPVEDLIFVEHARGPHIDAPTAATDSSSQ
jgi:apolipoprotein D and lipocalin family protein